MPRSQPQTPQPRDSESALIPAALLAGVEPPLGAVSGLTLLLVCRRAHRAQHRRRFDGRSIRKKMPAVLLGIAVLTFVAIGVSFMLPCLAAAAGDETATTTGPALVTV